MSGKNFIILAAALMLLIFVVFGARADNINCSANPLTAKTCDVYVGIYQNGGRQILSIRAHEELFNLLRSADSSTVINLYYIGNGGSINTGLALIAAIKDSKAQITSHIVGPVYSMHAVLPFATPKHLKISKYAIVMFHKGWIPIAGGTRSPFLVCKTKLYQEPFERCMETIKRSFEVSSMIFRQMIGQYLTAQELSDFNDGKDVYITGESFHKRGVGK